LGSLLSQERVFDEWGGPRVGQLLLVSVGATPLTRDNLGPRLAAQFEAAGGELIDGPQVSPPSIRRVALPSLRDLYIYEFSFSGRDLIILLHLREVVSVMSKLF
jgi:hypothetical protein